MDVTEAIQQVLLALAYYFGLLAVVRLAGKRLAGQTTTFDVRRATLEETGHISVVADKPDA